MKPKTTLSIVLILFLTALLSWTFSNNALEAASKPGCGGGITINASCSDGPGCITPVGGGTPIPFNLVSGSAFVGNLCAGSYLICIPNCGIGSFSSDGSSETQTTITDPTECSCP